MPSDLFYGDFFLIKTQVLTLLRLRLNSSSTDSPRLKVKILTVGKTIQVKNASNLKI
jgi:hypothetical protein